MFAENHSDYNFKNANLFEKIMIIICFISIIICISDFVIAGHLDGCNVYAINLSVFFYILGCLELGWSVITAFNLDDNIQRRTSMYGINEDLIKFNYEYNCPGLFLLTSIIIQTLLGSIIAFMAYFNFHINEKSQNTCSDNHFYNYLMYRTTIINCLLILGSIFYLGYRCKRIKIDRKGYNNI